MKYTNVITTLVYKNNTFKIVRTVKDNENWYCAIDIKYLDANGVLTKALNGIQMHADRDLNRCIEHTKFAVDVEELKAQGINFMVAIEMLHTGKTREEVEANEELMKLVKELEK